MTTWRQPVLLWRDHSGAWSGAAVGACERIGALGATPAAVLEEIESFLVWRHRTQPWYPAPGLEGATLDRYAVSVRPQIDVHGKPHTAEHPIRVRVEAVHGVGVNGVPECHLPRLDVSFRHASSSLKDLVAHHTRQALQGSSPEILARHLPVAEVELAFVTLRVPTRNLSRADPEIPAELAEVVDALREPGFLREHRHAWQREAEVADLADALEEPTGGVLVVGPRGVGKTTLLVAAAREVERRRGKEVAPRFWRTNAARIIAGMRYLGEWQERVEELVDALEDVRGVLCVERLVDLIETGGEGPATSVGAFLAEFLADGSLRLVAEATMEELLACRRLLPGLVDPLRVFSIEPMPRDRALRVLERVAAATPGAAAGPVVDPAALVRTLDLFRRFRPQDAFPGRCVRFLREQLRRRDTPVAPLSAEAVVAAFAASTGLPRRFLRDEEPLDAAEVERWFASRVIGQPTACRVVSRLVATFKAGMNDPARPLGVLLFLGPTGVGKTELARALASCFFGAGAPATGGSETGSTKDPAPDASGGPARDRLLRLDMSEYALPGSGARLVEGAKGEPSELIQRVRQQPFQVVLFDEVEKADPEVFDVLLGLFDEGRLTDRFGRTTSFHSAVIVLTSNLGADRSEGLGFSGERPASFEAEARRYFRPELFNRIDDVVPFAPLGPDVVLEVTRKELREVAARDGLRGRGVMLEVSDALVAWLARRGCDARYGARQLQRTLERDLVAPLSRFLLDGDVIDATVCADVEGDRARFRVG